MAVSGQGGGGGGGGGMGGGMGSTDDDGETGMGMGGADAETCEDSTDCEDGYECAARRNALICVADQDVRRAFFLFLKLEDADGLFGNDSPHQRRLDVLEFARCYCSACMLTCAIP